MELRFLKEDDCDFVMSLEHRVTEESFRQRIAARNSFVLWEQGERVGLLSYFVLWERIPFLNHLILCESCRGRGLGTQAMGLWEDFLRENGYRIAVLSTQVDERAQFLYRRLGYVDCGGLALSRHAVRSAARALPAQGAVSPHAGQIAYKLFAAF